MSHVFISFSKKDRGFVEELDRRIRVDAGLDTWIPGDRGHAGGRWREEIDRAIEGCRALVVVMTPAARASEDVAYEWAYAMGLGKLVVPILLKKTRLHPKLRERQHLDLKAPDFWARLFEDLHRAAESSPGDTQGVTVGRDAPAAIWGAVEELYSPDDKIRKRAITNLAGMRDPAACAALVMALGHVAPDVREEAARTLVDLFAGKDMEPAVPDGLRGSTAVLARLVAALGDSNWRARVAAAVVLGKVGDSRVVVELLEALRDKDPGVRRAAAQALGEIGDAGAVEGLVGALGDGDIRVHGIAAGALGAIGEVAVVGLVGALGDSNGNVRRVAAELLGKIGDARAVEGLVGVLDDDDWSARWAAVQALREIGGIGVAEGLIIALGDDDPGVRLVARQALVEIGEAAVPGLVEALDDKNPDVCTGTAEALERIGTGEALEAVARWRESGGGGGQAGS